MTDDSCSAGTSEVNGACCLKRFGADNSNSVLKMLSYIKFHTVRRKYHAFWICTGWDPFKNKPAADAKMI